MPVVAHLWLWELDPLRLVEVICLKMSGKNKGQIDGIFKRTDWKGVISCKTVQQKGYRKNGRRRWWGADRAVTPKRRGFQEADPNPLYQAVKRGLEGYKKPFKRLKVSKRTFNQKGVNNAPWESSFSRMEGMEIQVMGVWEGMLKNRR